ncbi:unnamed protein product [Moneuplotes crassus]|uniref:Uncharacterized protein n=1 Tax=Euplotes crassus TaxID=5936 RepID=A0AAD1Y5A3_EUPCR|nr:unnamed protein product [Moneuplotes crassus]
MLLSSFLEGKECSIAYACILLSLLAAECLLSHIGKDSLSSCSIKKRPPHCASLLRDSHQLGF